ncbi:MAG TPA: DUF3014 domain-containing protein [Casimicrobiaceae bacterium]
MPQTQFEPTLPSLMVDDDTSVDRTRPAQPRQVGSSAWWIAAIAIIVAVAAAIYWWWQRQPVASAPPVAPPVAEAPLPAKAEPAIRHPIEDAQSGLKTSEADHLPALGESDAVLRAGLATLSGAAGFDRLFHPEEIVRRFVATVDNLPRKAVSAQVMVAKPVPGAFLAAGADDKVTISDNNAARYTPYVRLAQAVDTKSLVALYVRFYPLFQQAYHDLGYPSGYFNDRLIDVIDNLLATPQTAAPVSLVQPHVLYEFANPDLESLSAGQKIMLRMGSENASHVRTKLRELRRMLTGVVSPP